MKRIALVISLLSAALSWPEAHAQEKKWKWGDDASGAARQDQEAARGANDDPRSARYQIYENADGGNFPIPGTSFVGGVRPGRPGGVYGNGFGQSGFGGGAGILTGPVPSWQREPPNKEFNRCMCTQKFNCPSPGVSYGNCDVGKQYCCFSTQGALGAGRPPFLPDAGVHQHPGVLVGPGGPTGVVGRPPFRPGGGGLYQPGPTAYPGILSGPGGPTGIISRPLDPGFAGPTGVGGRPQGIGGGPGVGSFYRPGGPTGFGGRPQGIGGGPGLGTFFRPGGPPGVGVRPLGYGGFERHGGAFGVGGSGTGRRVPYSGGGGEARSSKDKDIDDKEPEEV